MGARHAVCLWAALFLAMPTGGCGDDAPISEPVIRPVRTLQVYASGRSHERTFPGTSRAALESKLSFKVAGTVNRVLVKAGDSVSKNQQIAFLDPTDYRLQVQDVEASLRSAEAQARNAESNYSRVRALYENRNASRNDLDAARTAYESARATVESVMKKLELTRLQLQYTTLLAPVGGAIAAVNVEENENVSPGQPVAVLNSGAQLEVAVAMPEGLIAQIREGEAVGVTFDALPDKQFEATVTEVGISSTGTATTFPVAVTLIQADADCRPGMAAEVRFRFAGQKGRPRMVVPSVAVGEDQKGRHVFVVEPTGTGLGVVRRRNVSVGSFGEDGLEILDGLQDGDRVVTAGVSRIQDGQQVRLTDAP